MADAKAANEAPHSTERLRQDMDQEIAKLRKDVEKLTALLRDISTNAAGIAKETLRERMEHASDNIHAAVDTTTTTVRRAVHERPVATLGVALGLGFILGQLLHRR
jgi:ElaB/YqjD/DUF883 family membrane-anchored ribosome-binding protein